MSTEAFYSALRGLAIAIAQFWLDWVSPVRFDSVFHLANGRVRVVIEKYTSKDDTQPVRTHEAN
jgi:hypothetical protein